MFRIGLFVCVAFSVVAFATSLPSPAAAQIQKVVGGTPPAPAPIQREVTFAARPDGYSGSLVIPLGAERDLASRAQPLSRQDRDAIARALSSARFSYGARQTLSLRGIGSWDRILIVGLGEGTDLNTVQSVGSVAGRALLNEPGNVTVLASGLYAIAVGEFATGMGLGEYRSDLYQASRRAATAPGPTLIVSGVSDAARALYRGRGRALIDAMAWTRDVSNEPGNVIYPESFVDRARAAFAGIPGVTIDVLDVPAMQQLGMGAILGSGAGSVRPPRILVVRYTAPSAPAGGPIVLAGKGITFDTGGISIKPGANMGNMKMDMSGAAAVVGAVLALSKSGAPVNVAAIAALSENMPDGGAIRPADVLIAMNGKSIEIISTDAEGRLVLADAVAWADAKLQPAAIIDVATLTGAVGTALGEDYAGLFSRHDALASQIDAAGRATGEAVWRLPLHHAYAGRTSSTIADIKNSSDSGPGAGTGAHFIGEFVNRETPWAHIDIAGVAWSGPTDQMPAGSNGWGVRLLEKLVLDWKPVPRGVGDGGQ